MRGVDRCVGVSRRGAVAVAGCAVWGGRAAQTTEGAVRRPDPTEFSESSEFIFGRESDYM